MAPPDFAWIEEAASHDHAPFRWRSRGATPSPDTINRLLWDRVYAQFVLDDGRPQALIQIYDVDLLNLTGYVSLLLARDTADEDSFADAAAVVFAHAFGPCRLRKLYLQCLGAQLEPTLRRLPAGGTPQGVLDGFEAVADDVFDDLHVYCWDAPPVERAG